MSHLIVASPLLVMGGAPGPGMAGGGAGGGAEATVEWPREALEASRDARMRSPGADRERMEA